MQTLSVWMSQKFCDLVKLTLYYMTTFYTLPSQICRTPFTSGENYEKVDFDKVENIVGKEENAGNQNFLLCPLFFLNSVLHNLDF